MSLLRAALLVAGKDLRIEMRSRVVLTQIAPFGGIVLVLFAFALDPDRGLLPRAAPGLYWTAVLLAALLAIGRAAAIEAQHGARDGLRLAPLDGAAVFLGKAAAVVVELLVLEVVLLAGVAVLYDVQVGSWAPVAVGALAATCGVAAVGTVYAGLASGARTRDTLVPLLVLPAVVPVALGGTRAFEWAFVADAGRAWPWVQLLVVFAAVYVMIGVLTYGALLEDA